MQSTIKVLSSIAVVKIHDLPLSSKPIATQVQVSSLIVDKDTESEDVNQAFFLHLHQFTRHLYAPLARFARQNVVQVKYPPIYFCTCLRVLVGS